MAKNTKRIVEEHYPWNIADLVQPHTLGRAFYMRPASRSQIDDKDYSTNTAFWRDILSERIGAERTVVLRGFNIFEWVPRNPGLYHTPEARFARDEAQHYVRAIEPRAFGEYLDSDGAPPDGATAFRSLTSGAEAARTVIYTPQGKLSMLRGGIGCVRFKSLHLKKGGAAWLMSATSTTAPDEGIPLLMDDNDYQRLSDGLHDAGAICCDVIGRTRFVAEEFSDLFSVLHGIPRLYVEVSEIRPIKAIYEPGQVSVAASFLSAFEGTSRIYASYVTFDPSRPSARKGAAQWLKEEYVERLYDGSLLTDFDQRAPMFANSLFALDQVLTSPDLAAKIAELRRLFGHFDWEQLDRFSYIEHQGDLIVTNNTITVTNSTNVVIQSTLTSAQLVAGTMAAGDDSERQKLQELLQNLRDVLPTAPFDRGEQAEALATQAKGLVEEAAKPQPNKTTLQVFGEGLRRTSEFVKDAVPAVVTIVGQIVSVVGRIHGISL
jgi:hypothetical protein